MNFADFSECFKRVQICHFQEDYVFNNFKIDTDESNEKHHLTSMTISEYGEYTISLSQKDTRYYSDHPDDIDIKYSKCKIIVGQQSDKGLKYVAGTTGSKRDTYI